MVLELENMNDLSHPILHARDVTLTSRYIKQILILSNKYILSFLEI